MQTDLLDFSASDERAGFRLHRVELFNWGTFHEQVWRLLLGGDNTLLTGDIGSGKSTLVDAVTTLLVPAQKITYNKAAGAESKERSLKSYVLGYYKSERAETGLAARAVALRDRNSYSVILGHFYNEGYDQHATLAQVLWVKDDQGQPARFYLVAGRPLSVAGDFADFGNDILALKKRLKQSDDVEVFDSFSSYGAAFRRRFGIDNEKALDLFNQTVSMKSVGNLTDFVRQHMLEPFPVAERVANLIHHFDDLNRAHEAVLKARDQINALEPLVSDAVRHTELSAGVDALRSCREALRPWFGGIKAGLLEERIDRLDQQRQRDGQRVAELDEQRAGQRGRRDELKQAIAENGGDRIERIKREITERGRERDERRQRAERYNQLAMALQLAEASSGDRFLANRDTLASEDERIATRQAELQNALTEASVEMHALKADHTEQSAELESLRSRRSNLPSTNLAIRDRLCEALGLGEEELPFVGELVQVREEERDWEGAIERVLHNFGLSMLVPDPHYARLAEWVDRTQLRGRLVYFRVRDVRAPGSSELHPESLVRKLQLKPDTGFYPWLEAELARRFDIACCDDLAAFRREKSALTQAGQIKGVGGRHEKDDRHRIDDRARYVLGWDNAAKLAAYEQQVATLERRMQSVADEIARVQANQNDLNQRMNLVQQMKVYAEFRELDWQPLVVEIERLERERQQIESESDVLRTLERQLQSLEEALTQTEAHLDARKAELARGEEKLERAGEQLRDAMERLVEIPAADRTHVFSQLEAMREEALGQRTLTVESCDNSESMMRSWMQAKIDAEDKRIARLSENIIGAMQTYQGKYPLETREMDVSIEAAAEYSAALDALKRDDLPRFETRFKELLNENTIREVAGFQAKLHYERQTILERIDTINRSLQEIDYNAGRYITLLAETAPDMEIRDFQQALRACTEGALTGSEDEQYSEAKFLQVKDVIQRFRGRDGLTEMDRRWTQKVTDVRNWFGFGQRTLARGRQGIRALL